MTPFPLETRLTCNTRRLNIWPTVRNSMGFERTIRRTTKPPARAGGFVQFANKVLIALP
jgi:hypothetical protein